jgi:predicted Zn-dependent peptidase
VPVAGVESVATVVLARTGSRYEKAETYGIAHFVEHMVFKGTKKYPTTKVLSEKIDGIGAQFNAFTGEEATAFYIRCAGKDLDLALEMLGQLTTQALMDEKEIEREKGVILEEIHMYEDDPSSYNAILFNEMFYANSGVGHNVLGTRETVSGMQREHFLNYLATWYGADNLVVVVAGKKSAVMAQDLEDKVEAAFVFPPKQSTHPAQEKFWEQDYTYGGRLHLQEREIEQIHYILGWPGIKRGDAREDALSLLSTIVGGNMSSRLFLQVRERRGLCYYISSFTDQFSDIGCFGANAGVNPAKLMEAVEATLAEFAGLGVGKNAIKPAELTKAKNYLTGQLTLSQESVYNLAVGYGMRYLHEGKIKTITERLADLQKVKLEQVRELAQELVETKKIHLSLIGNFTPEQKKSLQKMTK